MSRTSALGQFTLLPTLADTADITSVGTTMADRIEKYVMMRFANAAARDAVITVPEQGMQAFLTTPNVMTFYDGTAWRGEWVTTFTTQIDQGATTNIAKTTTSFEYRYDGPMIDFSAYITITAAGTAGTGVSFTVPVTPINSGGLSNIGSGFFFDASASLVYVSSLEILTANKLTFRTDQVAGGGVWGATPNLAVANGDLFRVFGRYRWV